MKSRSFNAVSKAAGLSALVAGLMLTTAATAQEVTLRFAHENAASHPVGQGAQFLAERVAELTDGRVEVRVMHGGELGGAPDVIEAVQLGSLEMASATLGVLESFAPEFDIATLPFLFRDADHLKTVMDGELGDILREAAEQSGIRVMAITSGGTRQLYGKRPVHTPADVEGMVIRVMEVPILVETWQQFGAQPTPVAFPEVYMALETGVVDASESSFISWLESSLYEVAPYGINISYADAGRAYVMNPDVAASMPEDLYAALEQAWDEAGELIQELYVKGEAEATEEAVARGATIIQADIEAFAEAAQPIHERFEPTLGLEWVERIRNTE